MLLPQSDCAGTIARVVERTLSLLFLLFNRSSAMHDITMKPKLWSEFLGTFALVFCGTGRRRHQSDGGRRGHASWHRADFWFGGDGADLHFRRRFGRAL